MDWGEVPCSLAIQRTMPNNGTRARECQDCGARACCSVRRHTPRTLATCAPLLSSPTRSLLPPPAQFPPPGTVVGVPTTSQPDSLYAFWIQYLDPTLVSLHNTTLTSVDPTPRPPAAPAALPPKPSGPVGKDPGDGGLVSEGPAPASRDAAPEQSLVGRQRTLMQQQVEQQRQPQQQEQGGEVGFGVGVRVRTLMQQRQEEGGLVTESSSGIAGGGEVGFGIGIVADPGDGGTEKPAAPLWSPADPPSPPSPPATPVKGYGPPLWLWSQGRRPASVGLMRLAAAPHTVLAAAVADGERGPEGGGGGGGGEGGGGPVDVRETVPLDAVAVVQVG